MIHKICERGYDVASILRKSSSGLFSSAKGKSFYFKLSIIRPGHSRLLEFEIEIVLVF